MGLASRTLILPCFFVVLVGCASSPPLYRGESSDVQRGMEEWRHGDRDAAALHFERATETTPEDADARAWLAEALRRSRQFEAATAAAQSALELQPDHAFALTVLGDLANPRLSGDQAFQSAEAAESFYRRALAADPMDPGALLSLSVMALRSGDDRTFQKCLTSMEKSELWSDSVMALARWTLESAPPHSILALNGDADTYPAWILQMRGVRRDVQVINVSLANLPDYRDRLGENGIPLPQGELKGYYDIYGQLQVPAKQFFQHLESQLQDGDLDRPLAVAITVPPSSLGVDLAGATLHGGVLVLHSDSPGVVDIEATRSLMRLVAPKTIAEPAVSPRDRSPVRWRGMKSLLSNPAAVTLRGLDQAIENADWEAASWFREQYLEYEVALGGIEPLRESFEDLDQEYRRQSHGEEVGQLN